jgi:sialate O-acetylesterase
MTAFNVKLITFLVTFLCLWQASSLPADVATLRLAPIFSDNMILQRDQTIAIWGWGTPRLPVHIKIGANETEARPNEDGFWSAKLPPQSATKEPFSIDIESVSSMTLHNVLVGDVWLCAGQSNMYFPLKLNIESSSDIANANYPLMRFFQVPPLKQHYQGASSANRWLSVTPQTAGSCSALAFYFARRIYAHSSVPTGIVQCAMPGLPLKAWISKDILGKQPKNIFCETSSVFNQMIFPLIGFGIKGTIWYHGEADIFGTRDYKRLLPAMIADWRARWKQGCFPFIIVQAPNFSERDDKPCGSAWAELREAQYGATKTSPNTWLVVSVDTVSDVPARIHPKDKRRLGERIAAMVLAKEIGDQEGASSPVFKDMKIRHRQAILRFEPLTAPLTACGAALRGFSIAGPDRTFYWAQAKLMADNNAIIVWSDKVSTPVAVRYNWGDNPVGNLYNSRGLPVVPFRTDHWSSPLVMSRYDFTKYLMHPEL